MWPQEAVPPSARVRIAPTPTLATGVRPRIHAMLEEVFMDAHGAALVASSRPSPKKTALVQHTQLVQTVPWPANFATGAKMTTHAMLSVVDTDAP